MTDQPRNIGLDFDDTLTAAPSLARGMVELAQSLGHKVYVVTCRRNTAENRQIIAEFMAEYGFPELPVFMTNLGPKLNYMRSLGIRIDFWIDDDPFCIIHGK